MTLPPSFAKVSGSAATSLVSTESKQADGKNKGGSKDKKGWKKQQSEDGNGNLIKNITQPIVQTYRQGVVERQLCNNPTTRLTSVDGQNLDVRKVAFERRLLQQLCKSSQPGDEQKHPRQQTSRIPHLPLKVPQGDSQEEISLTARVGV
jgi:hypothetical protein